MRTPTARYPCCEHCVGEGCPKIQGHNMPCGHRGCLSYESIMAQAGASNPTDHAMEDIMGWREDENLRHMKEELVEHASSVLGREPTGMRTMLQLLSHPRMLEHTITYFTSINPGLVAMCLHYEAPWNCAREAAAKFENMAYGWTGGMYNDEPNTTWCENCLSKVMGRPALEEDDEVETIRD